jgi:hypothetical protein
VDESATGSAKLWSGVRAAAVPADEFRVRLYPIAGHARVVRVADLHATVTLEGPTRTTLSLVGARGACLSQASAVSVRTPARGGGRDQLWRSGRERPLHAVNDLPRDREARGRPRRGALRQVPCTELGNELTKGGDEAALAHLAGRLDQAARQYLRARARSRDNRASRPALGAGRRAAGSPRAGTRASRSARLRPRRETCFVKWTPRKRSLHAPYRSRRRPSERPPRATA